MRRSPAPSGRGAPLSASSARERVGPVPGVCSRPRPAPSAFLEGALSHGVGRVSPVGWPGVGCRLRRGARTSVGRDSPKWGSPEQGRLCAGWGVRAMGGWPRPGSGRSRRWAPSQVAAVGAPEVNAALARWSWEHRCGPVALSTQSSGTAGRRA